MNNSILFLAVIFFAASCTNTNTNTETFEEKVVGEWQSYSFVINCQDATNNVPFAFAGEDGCMDIWDTTQCTSIAINSDGNGVITNRYAEQSFDENFIYTLDETNQKVKICIDSHCIDFSLINDRLLQIMDEDNCLCEFEYDKKD